MVAKCIFFFFQSVSRSSGVETATCVKWLQHVFYVFFFFFLRSVSRYFGVEAATCVKWLQKGIFFFFFRSLSRSFGVKTATCVKWLQHVFFFSGAFPVVLVRKQQHVSNGCKMYLFFLFPERFPFFWCGNSNMCQMVAKCILFFFRSVSRYFGVETATCVKWLQNVPSSFSGAFPVLLVWKQQHVSNGCKMYLLFSRSVSRSFVVETAPCFKWLQNGNIFSRSVSCYFGVETTCFKWLQNGDLCFPERFPLF